jgi:hydrogenase expression/formation protein HypC
MVACGTVLSTLLGDLQLMCLAIPGRILSIRGDDPLVRVGRVDFGGAIKEINLVYTPEAQPGEYVLAHVGFAMAIIDEAEARRIYDALCEVAEASAADPRAGAGA